MMWGLRTYIRTYVGNKFFLNYTAPKIIKIPRVSKYKYSWVQNNLKFQTFDVILTLKAEIPI